MSVATVKHVEHSSSGSRTNPVQCSLFVARKSLPVYSMPKYEIIKGKIYDPLLQNSA